MRFPCLRAAIAALFSTTLLYASATQRRAITVQDSIEMTRWADSDYLLGADSENNIANFSPDGKHFVIVLRKADLATNANVYSVYLFRTASLFRSPAPRVVVRMQTKSNQPAIRGVKWLSDNRTLAFVGVREPGPFEVFTFDIATGELRERTHHLTDVDQFDISPDGHSIVFTAKTPNRMQLTEEQRRHGVVIEDQTLEQVLAGDFNQTPFDEGLYLEQGRERAVDVPSTHEINSYTRVFFSPSGKYAAFTGYFRQTDPAWTEYQNEALSFWGRNPAPVGGAAPISEYFLLNCANGAVHPLLKAPAVYSASLRWAPDGRSIALKTFLPLGGVSPEERLARAKEELPVEISIPGLEMRRIGSARWEAMLPKTEPNRPQVFVQESLNSPPVLVARDRGSHKTARLLDLNPQFAQLRFGPVKVLHFEVDGIAVLGGLYLPPDYVRGRRYPLVVQTHGFDPKRFSMDGRDEWSSGFAARVLAAHGIMVVQMESFAHPEDHDRVGGDRSLGSNFEQSFRRFSNDCDRKVVEQLTNEGLIDPARVGISAFSRTVWFVAYLLTHNREPKFRAAMLTDGIDGGYFDYIAGRLTEFDEDNGGKTPFAPGGLDLWLKESPSFHLDRVCLPLRLVSIEDRLAQWEWFVAGKMQNKPVELIEIPGGSHLLERPRDRQIAMQGMLDWFRFWLEDYVDPDPKEQAQYDRWKKLKALEAAEPKGHCFE